MEGYALLIGVTERSDYSTNPIKNRFLPGAKHDVDKLSNLITNNITVKYKQPKKLVYGDASWVRFTSELDQIINSVENNSPTYLFISFTGHSFIENNSSILCFKDLDINENVFLSKLADIPSHFTTFVLLNACYSGGIFSDLGLPFNFKCPIAFLGSSDPATGSISSSQVNTTTYFMKHFMDTWKQYNFLKPNYPDFIALLQTKIRDGLNPLYKTFNNPDFFNTTVPFFFNTTSNSISSSVSQNKMIISFNSDNYIQVDLEEPHSSYSIHDSFTIDLNEQQNNSYVKALISDIKKCYPAGGTTILDSDLSKNWDQVEYIGVVLTRINEGSNLFPYTINYCYSDDPTKNSNGLIVIINTENNFQLVAHDRTTGRVTNKIGGI